MKRLAAVFLALLILIPSVYAQTDIKGLTDADLLKLHEATVQELHDRGKYPFVELKNGATGDEVARLQRRLAELGYYTKDATGKFDSQTAAALKAFEKASKLKSDGVASVSDQELLFSKRAASKPTPTPKPTKKPTPKPTKKPTPKPTKTPDPRRAYGKFDYTSVARYPSEYKGTKVKIVGRVIQVLGDRTSGFDLRVATRGSYGNVVYITTKGGHAANILEKDRITFYCVMQGDYTYRSTMGQSITLPLAKADFYDTK